MSAARRLQIKAAIDWSQKISRCSDAKFVALYEPLGRIARFPFDGSWKSLRRWLIKDSSIGRCQALAAHKVYTHTRAVERTNGEKINREKLRRHPIFDMTNCFVDFTGTCACYSCWWPTWSSCPWPFRFSTTTWALAGLPSTALATPSSWSTSSSIFEQVFPNPRSPCKYKCQ